MVCFILPRPNPTTHENPFTQHTHIVVTDANSAIQIHIDTIQDEDLKARAASLSTLANARWAPSTTDKYERGWAKWEAWCRRHPESVARPASSFYITLYANDLVLEGCRYGALDTAAAAIRWGHLKEGYPNPMENDYLSIIFEGAQRIIGKP